MGLAPLTSMKRMPFYHSGSATFGSFLIAIMQFVGVCMRRHLKGLKKVDRNGKVFAIIGYFIEFCLWCCQKIIEFINRNAYIMIVIDGNSFCWSAFQALKLMIANIMSVAAVNIVGDLLLFLAKLSISIGTAFLAFVMLNGDEYKDEVSSPILICSIISIFHTPWLPSSWALSKWASTPLYCAIAETRKSTAVPRNTRRMFY